MRLYLWKKLVLKPCLEFNQQGTLIEKNNQMLRILNSLRNFYLIYLTIPLILISFFYLIGFPFLWLEDTMIKLIFPNLDSDQWKFYIYVFDYSLLAIILILYLFLPTIKIILLQKAINLLENLQRKIIAQNYDKTRNSLKINHYLNYVYKTSSDSRIIKNLWIWYWYICLIPILPNFSRIWISKELKHHLSEHLKTVSNYQNTKVKV